MSVALTPAFFAPPQKNQNYESLRGSKGSYLLGITQGTGPLSFENAEQAVRCLAVFLRTDLSKGAYTEGQKINLVQHVETIDRVIDTYNASVNESGWIAFFTVLLLVLTIGLYNLRQNLLSPTISQLLPEEFKSAAARAVRTRAFELLSSAPERSREEGFLHDMFSRWDYRETGPRTPALATAFKKHRLDTIRTAAEDGLVRRITSKKTQVTTWNRTRDWPGSTPYGHVGGLYRDPGDQTDMTIEATLADGTKRLFKTHPGDSGALSMTLFEYAWQVAIDAQCAAIVEKYTPK